MSHPAFPRILALLPFLLIGLPVPAQAKDRHGDCGNRDGGGHHGGGGGHHSSHHRSYYHYPSSRYYCPPRSGFSLSFGFAQPYYYSRPVVRTTVSRNVVYDVQRALLDRGYSPGPADGVTGPRTRQAILDYQYDRGLPATGQIDEALLRSLRLL
jgi:hypothetical protein